LAASLTVFSFLATAAVLAFSHFLSKSGPGLDGALRIEPPALRLEDRLFGEGDLVRGHFRVVNASQRPLTINAVRSSCSCVASVAEGERKPPFEIGPSSWTGITLTTTALSIRGSEQSYQIAVEASIEGHRLQDHFANLSFRVADSLKAEPAILRVYEAPNDTRTSRSVVLYTYRDLAELPEPTVRVMGSGLIHASLRRSVQDRDQDRGTVPKFVVTVSIDPVEDADAVAGEIEVVAAGQPPMTIPVACSFRRDFRMDPQSVEASGRPGTRVERDLFQEFSTDRWRDLELVSRPKGCDVEIRPFDKRTNSIPVKVTIPAEGKDLAQTDYIVFAPRDHSRLIRVPVHYSLEE